MNVTPSIADYLNHAATESKLSRAETPSLHARLALDAETRADAFRLRHLCYHSNGYIDAREDGQFSDEHDRPASNRTMVIYLAGQAVASVRVCCTDAASDDPAARELPLAKVFGPELDALRGGTGRAIEINRLVRHPDHAHDQGLVFVLFRMAGFLIKQDNPDFVASCVRTNHAGFYRRMRFEHVAGPRPYAGLKFSTNFLACPRSSFDAVQRFVPVLRMGQETLLRYGALFDGETVSVLDTP